MSEIINDDDFTIIPDFEDYEISKEGIVRRKTDKRILKPFILNGYQYVRLNKKSRMIHRLLAQTFLPNDDPDNKVVVDHINHNKLDNRLENLRWTTILTNVLNKSSYNGYKYEYLDELPPNSIVVFKYGEHEFENLYYHIDSKTFYVKVENQYRSCHWNSRNEFRVYDIHGKRAAISFNKVDFKIEGELVN